MRLLQVLLWGATGVLLVVTGYLVVTPTGRYIARAAWEQAKILWRREPIQRMVANPDTSPELRDKLRLVLEARDFAAGSIGLDAGRSFTTYSSLDRDTLVLTLSAAYQDRLEPRTWWFPVVGRVPYKGYFDFARAQTDEREHQVRGFDTYLRPVSAFSTLGWFNDPLMSTTVRAADSLSLTETVIHELTHNTIYLPGQAVFNESFATFVGYRGAAWFFRARGQSGEADRMDARWHDTKVLALFWARLGGAIDSAFAAHPDDRDARLAAREVVYGRARTELVEEVGPRLLVTPRAALERARLDNAAVLARRLYLTDLDLFDAVWVREGADLARTVGRLLALAESRRGDPFGAVRGWLAAGS